MKKEEKMALLQDRFNKLSGSLKNVKCPGVCQKLARQIRNMQKEN